MDLLDSESQDWMGGGERPNPVQDDSDDAQADDQTDDQTDSDQDGDVDE